jgi:hypothetical protein
MTKPALPPPPRPNLLHAKSEELAPGQELGAPRSVEAVRRGRNQVLACGQLPVVAVAACGAGGGRECAGVGAVSGGGMRWVLTRAIRACLTNAGNGTMASGTAAMPVALCARGDRFRGCSRQHPRCGVAPHP